MPRKLLSVMMPTLVITSVAVAAFAQPQQQAPTYVPGPWHMWEYGMPFWGMFPMMLLFLLFFGAIIFLFGRGVGGGAMHRWGPHAGDWGDPTRSALQILNDRYARGEIQKSEFEEKRRDIVAKL